MGNYKNKQEFNTRLENFKQLIAKGYSVSRATRLANISITTGYKHAKKLDRVGKHVTNLTNHWYFDIIDTEAKAYLLGFFIADGCIRKGYGYYSMSLCNAIDDEEIIKLFKSEICPENKISYRKNKGRKDTCGIRWSSQNMVKILEEKYKIIQRKTFDFNFEFPFETLPDKLFHHFIRGFLDGDGYVGQTHIEFISTSKPFMEQIASIFVSLFGVSYYIREKPTKNVIEYMLYFTGVPQREMMKWYYEWLYKDANFFLKRKRGKFEIYLNAVLNRENKISLSV